jgi:hypothetical protein
MEHSEYDTKTIVIQFEGQALVPGTKICRPGWMAFLFTACQILAWRSLLSWEPT